PMHWTRERTCAPATLRRRGLVPHRTAAKGSSAHAFAPIPARWQGRHRRFFASIRAAPALSQQPAHQEDVMNLAHKSRLDPIRVQGNTHSVARPRSYWKLLRLPTLASAAFCASAALAAGTQLVQMIPV